MKSLNLDRLIKENLKDSKFKKAWKKSESQYQVVRQLIKARIEKGISQRDLAKRAKTTQAVISRIENMSVNPSIVLLDRLAQALGKKLQIRFLN